MKQIKDIQIAPTNFMLDVYFGEDVEAISEQLDRLYDWQFDAGDFSHIIEEMKGRKGFTDEVSDDKGNNRFVMFVRDENDLITVGHEVIHVTWYVQHFTGFNFSWESQELQAYLHDYLVYEILKRKDNETTD